MKLKLTAVAVALMLVATGAVAAMPGNAPDSAQADDHANADDHAPDDAEDADDGSADTMNESESDADDMDANESESGDAGPPADVPGASDSANASDASVDAGPPVDMPSQVPDFVTQIHEVINQHVNGDLPGSDLGAQLSDLLSNGDEGENADAAASGQ
jgi:hypothetical protein